MYEFIEGELITLMPSAAIINVGGIGYNIEISLTTYTEIKNKKIVKLLIHYVVREDAHLLFGFYTTEERQLFRYLISVNGIGVNTARMMLSSMNTDELIIAIVKEDVNSIKAVKGIGQKTAQRLILELKDTLSKLDIDTGNQNIISNKTKEEALLALQTLGFNKIVVEKALNKIIENEPQLDVGDLIKKTLKIL